MATDILDRVKKLLRLAKNATNENEAALAAQRASELMREHEIHEAMVSLDEVSAPRTPEAIEERHAVTKTKQRVAWHWSIVSAVTDVHGAKAFWNSDGGGYVVFGRLTTVQTVSYISQYLMREVERLTKAHCDSDGRYEAQDAPRSYRNAFRLGCARRVASRLRVTHEERQAATPSPSAGVMVIVERDRDEVDAEYEKFSKRVGMRSMGSIGQLSHAGGYNAGKRAGDKVALTSRARGGLPAGTGSLKGKKGGKS